MRNYDRALSKYLSFLLRHKAYRRELTVRTDGLVHVNEVLEYLKCSMDDVEAVVQSSRNDLEGDRFELVEHSSGIRIIFSLKLANPGEHRQRQHHQVLPHTRRRETREGRFASAASRVPRKSSDGFHLTRFSKKCYP